MTKEDEMEYRLRKFATKSSGDDQAGAFGLPVQQFHGTTPRLSPSGEMVERARELLADAFREHYAAIYDGKDEKTGESCPVPWEEWLERASKSPASIAAILAALTSTGSNRLSLGEIRAQAFEEAAKVADEEAKNRDDPFGDDRWESGAYHQAKSIATAIRALSGQSGEALDHQ